MDLLKNRRSLVVIILLLLFGAAVRVYYFAYPFGRSAEITVDEAVYGVQALQILGGARPVFYPAQDYTGSFSAYISALPFGLFGASAFWLKFVPLVFSLLTIYLIYELALKVYGREAGLLALFLTALGTPFWNNWSSRAGTGYVEATFIGLLILLLTLKIVGCYDIPNKYTPAEFGLLGSLSGIGFWVQPTIIYFVLPSLFFLFVNLKSRLFFRPVLFFVAGLIIGAAPVIYSNLLLRPQGTTNALLKKPWGVRIAAVKLIEEGFPVMLGGRTSNSTADFNPVSSAAVYIMFLVSLVFFASNVFVKLDLRRPALLVFLFFISVICVFLLSSPFNQLSVEPRYIFSLYAAVPVILGFLISRMIKVNRWVVIPVAALYLFNFALGLYKAGPLTFLDGYSFKPLVSYLGGKNISFAITTPAVGHRLMFFSQGQIEAAVRGGGITQARFENLNTKVTRARDSDPRLVAYICLEGETACSSFRLEAADLLKNLFEQKTVNGVFEVESSKQ